MFLECLEDNLLRQLVREPAGGGALVDLLFVNRGLVGDVLVGGSLGQRNHKMSEFSIVVKYRRVPELPPWTSSGQTLALFRTLIDRVSPEGQRGPGTLDN